MPMNQNLPKGAEQGDEQRMDLNLKIDLERASEHCFDKWRLTPLTSTLKASIRKREDREQALNGLLQFAATKMGFDHLSQSSFLVLTVMRDNEFSRDQLETMVIQDYGDTNIRLRREEFVQIVSDFWKTHELLIVDKIKAWVQVKEEEGNTKPRPPEVSGVRQRLTNLHQLQVLEHKRLALRRLRSLDVPKFEAGSLVDHSCYLHSIMDAEPGKEDAKKGLTGYDLFKSPALFGGLNTKPFRRGLALAQFESLSKEASVGFFLIKATYNACEGLKKRRLRKLLKDKVVPIKDTGSITKTEDVVGGLVVDEFEVEAELQQKCWEWLDDLKPAKRLRVQNTCNMQITMGRPKLDILTDLAQKWERAQALQIDDEGFITSLESELKEYEATSDVPLKEQKP